MNTFAQRLCKKLFSKALSSSGWLDGFFSIAFLQKANGKFNRKKNFRRGSPFSSLGLYHPQVELLECRITPATLPTASLLSQDHSLVFITQDLVDRVPQEELANACVVTLDPAKDAIWQISSELANRSGLETLRIISHGEAGMLHFGNQVVDQGVLVARGGEIATWANSLAPNADLLLYGCAVAQSEVGQHFVMTLSQLTGADVAGSADTTGAGGNTTLEYASGGVVDASLRASAQEWEAAQLQLDQSGDFTYSSDGSAITITGYTGAGGAVTIPASILGLPVTAIGFSAFSECTGLTAVTIPSSVTAIGNYAFYGCFGLTSVTIPDSVTSIGFDAFYGCSGLTSVTIPASVTSIGGYAFTNCTNLTSISVDGANPSYSSADGILYNKAQTTLLQCPQGITGTVSLPATVTSIIYGVICGLNNVTAISVDGANPTYSSADGILYNKDQTTLLQCPGGKTGAVSIPATATAIGEAAFLGCIGLTSITFPGGLTAIGAGAFADCIGLNSLYFLGNAPSLGFSYSYEVFRSVPGTIYYLSGTTGWTNPFGGLDAVAVNYNNNGFNFAVNNGTITITGYTGAGGAVTIPPTIFGLPVTAIGYGAFKDCNGLTSVTIPNSVTAIGYGAFEDCTSLTAINMDPANPSFSSADGILYDKAQTTLIQCPGGKTGAVTIPDSVTAIGEYAFYGCTSLTSVTIIPSSVTAIGYGAFYGCTSLPAINVDPANPSFSSKEGILYNKVQTTLIQCPEGKTGAVTIPNSVIAIGYGAFFGCSGLTSVTIPASVTTIGYGAFSDCSGLTSVTIPNTVTTIGESAFAGCRGLTSVTIPASVTTIGYGAFSDCSGLTSVTIPNSVTTIGGDAFYGCTSLNAITVEATNPSFSSADGILYDKAQTTLIQCPGGKTGAVTIPDSVTAIGNSSFIVCTGLTSVTIPNTVTTIGDYAFLACTSLTTITIPRSVTAIGFGAFYGCSGLTAISVDAANQNFSSADGILYNKDQTTVIQCPGGKTGAAIIPNTVTTIGYEAFYGCPSLTAINVDPANQNFSSADGILYNKDQTTLIQCPGGKTGAITIPRSVTDIGPSAFSGCTGLNSVTIPSSVTAIGAVAFSGCTGLTSFYFLGNAPSVGLGVFNNVPGTIYYLSGTTGWTNPFGGLNTVAVNYNSNGFNWAVNNGAITITDYTGSGGAVTIPATIFGLPVTTIGAYALQNKSNLTGVTIPASVTTIGYYAFYGCTGLTSVTIPDRVTSIGDFAFYGCTGLTSVTIPDRVTAIGDFAFYGCSGLAAISVDAANPSYSSADGILYNKAQTTLIQCPQGKTGIVTIPNSVTSIGNSAFYGCIGLTNVTIPAGVTSIGGHAFSNCTGLTSVTIPVGVTSIGELTFSGCTGLTSVTIPNSVTSIFFGAFLRCTGLTNVTIPNSVTTMGNSAFEGCSGLTAITIPVGVTSISIDVFRGCTSLTAISVDAGNPNLSSAGGILYNKAQTTLINCPQGKTGIVTIPNTVTTIGNSAFNDCTGLTAVTIPDSVTSIDHSAFEGSIGLTSVTIPSSVTDIGFDVFSGCTGLTAINVDAANPNFSSADGILYNKAQTTLLQCPQGKTGIVTIPASVTSIGGFAFSNCTGLTAITIPDSVTTIGFDPFASCSGLTAIIVDAANPIYSSADGILYNKAQTTLIQCPLGKIGIVTIPSSVTDIGFYPFASCSGLTAISVDAGNPEFSSADGILYNKDQTTLIRCPQGKIGIVTIPSSVTSIGYRAFSGCTGLTAINVDAANPNYSSTEGILYNKAQTTLIQCPGGKTGAVIIPSSVATIGYGAFSGCISLTSVTISAGVTGISYNVFEGCTGLTSFYFLGNAPSLDYGAFNNIIGTVYYLAGTTGWTNPFGGLPSHVFTLAPTNILLSNSDLPENSPSGAEVATLTSASVVAGDGFTYTLVAGAGSADNAAFTIEGINLKLALVPDFETKSSYSVRIRSADASNVAFEKEFTVSITDVNEAPIANSQIITPTEDTVFSGTLTGSDIEGSTLTYSVVSQGSKGSVSLNPDGSFTYTPNGNATGTDSITFKVNDGALDSSAATVTVNITAVNDAPINEAIPQISGPTRMAGVLTVTIGTWNDAADGNPGFDFSYQWYRLGDEQGTSAELISGANGSDYTVQAPDLGKFLRVRVAAADRGVPGSISVSAFSSILRIPGVKPLAISSGAIVDGNPEQGDSSTPSAPVIPFPGFTGEVHISTLEVNEGGILDTELVIGAGEGGGPHVKVISVNDNQENGSFMAYDEAFRGGVFVSVGDVTGDGLADIVTSAGPGGGPHIKVFDRATMTEVISFFAYSAEFRGGATVAVVDVDLDGVGEIVTGAGPGGGSHVKVFKISDGAIVLHNEFFAFDPMLQNGIHVSGGDIDGDGRVELVVGLDEGVGPLVGVYDANSTQQIDLFFAYSQDFTGGTRVSVSDGDGDGIGDLITGAGPGGSAHVKVFKNIRTGRVLAREFIAQPGSNGVVLSI